MTYSPSRGRGQSLHQWRHCALYRSSWKRKTKKRETVNKILSVSNVKQCKWPSPWQHPVSILFVHWLLQNHPIHSLWKRKTTARLNKKHIKYIAESKQIKYCLSSSYHNSVSSNYYVRSLQVFLKQMNTHNVINMLFSRIINNIFIQKGVKLTKGILLATSRAFCLAVSTAYSCGALKSLLSRVSLNQDGTTSNRKPWNVQERKKQQWHETPQSWLHF